MQEKVVAIDGPAGAGKSTIAKMVAEKIHYTYIDSGAMYRALTLKVLKLDVDLCHVEQIVKLAQKTDIDFVDNQILLDGLCVESEIREETVSKHVSQVAAIPEVRKIMVEKQRQIAFNKNVVMDGRDVGTVIFPNAFIKFYITASVEERAIRRYQQLQAVEEIDCENDHHLDTIRKQIEARDLADMSRADSPLKIAENAIVIDTSNKSVVEVLNEVVDKIRSDGGGINVL